VTVSVLIWNVRRMPAEDGVESLVGDLFFVVEGADVSGYEGFDTVPESSRCLTERHCGAEPSGCSRVSAVVDAQRFLTDDSSALSRSGPVRCTRTGVVASSKEQTLG
jgi:hypothetical protein